MNIRSNLSTGTKTKLSQTLKNWFPILMANIEDLEDVIKEHKKENPIINVVNNKEENFSQYQGKNKDHIGSDKMHKSNENLEKFSISHKSIYDVLDEQICFPLFPTPKSQEIAYKIVQNITDEGYFDGDIKNIAKELNIKSNEVEKIRLRFQHCEPIGICAKDLAESLKFQLNSSSACEKTYKTALILIDNFENIYDFCNLPEYKTAIKIIKGFNNPPAIDFLKDSQVIIPDIIVSFVDDKIVVNINNDYYPDISIDTEGLPQDDEFVKHKVRDARNLIDAMQMRKSTLYKIGLMIVEYQYDYFMGGAIKPLRLKDLADEFGYNPSTISRAIANKFLESHMGLTSLKNFFSTEIDGDLSNSTVKDYMLKLIKKENKQKPYSDFAIAQRVEKEYGCTIERRTISKYRYILQIPSSSKRKKEYLI